MITSFTMEIYTSAIKENYLKKKKVQKITPDTILYTAFLRVTPCPSSIDSITSTDGKIWWVKIQEKKTVVKHHFKKENTP